jgi:hypothetical protein
MKIAVFEAEPREASAFEILKPANEVQLVAEPLRTGNAHAFADAGSDLDAHLLGTQPCGA